MDSLHTRIAPLLYRVDALIPLAIKASASATRSEELRRARFLLLVVAFSCFTALVSTVLHVLLGNTARAAFIAFLILPFFVPVLLMRRTGRVVLAAHVLCGLLTLGVLASPFFSDSSARVFVAMISIPMAAVVSGGWRTGVTWTVIGTLLLGISVTLLPVDSLDRTIAWSTMIMTLVAGCGLSIADYMHAQAVDEANTAREHAEESMRVRQAAEAALLDTRTLFQAAFHQSPSVVQLTDRVTGELLEVSQGFLDLFGCSRAEALGSTLIDLGFMPDHDTRKRFVAELSDPRMKREVEIPVKNRAGDDIVVSATAKLLEVAGRTCLLTHAIDITDRKRNDEVIERHRRDLEFKFAERGRLLKASQAQLRESERLAAVGTLAAGIAHQINNPIGGVVAAAEFALLSRGEPDADAKYIEALQTARDEAMRCGRIVKSVLQFARDEPTAKWVEDLNPIVRRTAELARSYIEDRGGELTIETSDANLPVLVSPIDIEQVVLNLLRNAAESSAWGARVIVETRRTGDFAELSVVDDGRGIPEDARSKIFDPFYTTRIGDGGTGLGLSVVHGVVNDHGGSVDIASPPAGGSQFRVILPLANESAS